MSEHDTVATIQKHGKTRAVPLTAYQDHYHHHGWRLVIEPGAAEVDDDVLYLAVRHQPGFLQGRSDTEIETWLADTRIDWLRDALMDEYRRRIRLELQRRRDAWMTKYAAKWGTRADEIWAAGHEGAHLYLTADRTEVETENEFDLIAMALQETCAHA